MNFGELNYCSLGRHGLLLVVIIASYSLTVIIQPQVVGSFPQMSSVIYTPLNHTSPPFIGSSQELGPPMIMLGAPAEVAPQEPLPQQNSLYENPQYGFAIQYPSNWQVEEGNASGTAVVAAISSPLENNFDTFAENFAIGIQNLRTGTSLDDYGQAAVALLKSQPPGSDFELTDSPVSTTLGGLPAQKIEYTMTSPSDRAITTNPTKIQGIQVWTINDDSAYVVSFAAAEDQFSSYLPTIQKIIDTFRITNSTQ